MRPPEARPPRREDGRADSKITLGKVQHAKRNPLAGLQPLPCQCGECRWYRAADKAIATNGVVRVAGSPDLFVVADTVIAETVANGTEIPDTYRLVRGDGRTVYVFRDPDAAP